MEKRQLAPSGASAQGSAPTVDDNSASLNDWREVVAANRTIIMPLAANRAVHAISRQASALSDHFEHPSCQSATLSVAQNTCHTLVHGLGFSLLLQ